MNDQKTAHSAVLRKGRLARGPMPGCGMHSRPKLAEKARYNSLQQQQQECSEIYAKVKLHVDVNLVSLL